MRISPINFNYQNTNAAPSKTQKKLSFGTIETNAIVYMSSIPYRGHDIVDANDIERSVQRAIKFPKDFAHVCMNEKGRIKIITPYEDKITHCNKIDDLSWVSGLYEALMQLDIIYCEQNHKTFSDPNPNITLHKDLDFRRMF